MGQIAERFRFYDNGNDKRIKENFQGYIFEGIDLSARTLPISFYRSDFRSVKFIKCLFLANDFSRADIIDSVIDNSRFEKCLFRYSEIVNTSFYGSNINDTIFQSATCSRLIFDKCSFSNGKWRDVTVNDCVYRDCDLEKVEMVKNSMNEVKFERSRLIDMDLSNMTALNLYFSDCYFQNLTLDADYLGSYFFKGKFAENIRLKYRGRYFNMKMDQRELLGNLFRIYLEAQRYYEAINLFVQHNILVDNYCSPWDIVEFALNQLLLEPNYLKRSYQMRKIFDLFEFYFNSESLNITDYFSLFAYFDQRDERSLSLQDQLEIDLGIQKLKILVEKTPLTSLFQSQITANTAYLEIIVPRQQEIDFIAAFELTINAISGSDEPAASYYTVISKREGSIIYDILINASVGLALLKALKLSISYIRSIGHETAQIMIDYSINKRVLKEITAAENLNQLKKIKEFQNYTDRLDQDKNKNLGKEASKLASTIQSAKYFPNAFTKSS